MMMQHGDYRRPTNAADAKKRIKDKFGRILEVDAAKKDDETSRPILHPDVDAAINEWLMELNYQDELQEAGIEPRRTSLLYGPPGTGKTTLAHHIAARLALPLVCIESEGIVDCWVGSSAKNLGEVFDCLDLLSPNVVVLFDEFDSLAAKRKSVSGADQERTAMLNVMLRRIEMFKGIAICATNRASDLDSALWRRLGMQIEVKNPRAEERRAILESYGRHYALQNAELSLLTDLTDGASPSLLRQLMEGMKRALIMGRESQQAVAVFKRIVTSITPPPDFDRPQLWATDSPDLDGLANMKWPPARGPK